LAFQWFLSPLNHLVTVKLNRICDSKNTGIPAQETIIGM